MLVVSFPAGVFGTNCYVLASAAGAECIVIDPGMDAVEPLQEALREHDLKPVAVVLTHGHADHTWSVAPVCTGYDIPAYVHDADRAMTLDPLTWHGPALGAMLGTMPIPEPERLAELSDGVALNLAGVSLLPRHTPGHTAGSTAFEIALADAPGLLAGDLLFAGSIGRVDLPGGSMSQMTDSLARVILPMADETVVLPGHGPATTIGRERRSNPYLQDLRADGADLGRSRPGR